MGANGKTSIPQKKFFPIRADSILKLLSGPWKQRGIHKNSLFAYEKVTQIPMLERDPYLNGAC